MEQYFGTVYRLERQVTGQGKRGMWKKQTVIVEIDQTKKNRIPVSFWNSEADIAENLRDGEHIKFMMSVKGREYNDRFFVDLEGSSLQSIGEPDLPVSRKQEPVRQEESSNDSLPF